METMYVKESLSADISLIQDLKSQIGDLKLENASMAE